MTSLQARFLAMGLAILVGPLSAHAQVLADAFRGVWKYMESKMAECSHSDWNTPKHDDTHILVSPKDATMHEGLCTMKWVK